MFNLPPIDEQNTWYQNVLFVLLAALAYLLLWPFLLYDYIKGHRRS